MSTFFTEGPEQGTDAWLDAKLGLISGTRASSVIAGPATAARRTLYGELLRELDAGFRKSFKPTWEMQRGLDLEDEAVAYYAYMNDLPVAWRPPLLQSTKDVLVGVSPDAMWPDLKRGAEIKCLDAHNHISVALFDDVKKAKKDYYWQIIMNLLITDYDRWDYFGYCPDLKSPKLIGYQAEFSRENEAVAKDLDALDAALEGACSDVREHAIHFGVLPE